MNANPTQVRIPIDAANVIDVLARQPLPLAMGQIAVVADGTLRVREDEPLRFSFSFGGALVSALCTVASETMTVDLSADLGPLPYSVQSVTARQGVIAMLGPQGESDGQFEIGDKNMIHFRGALAVERPFTPASLMTALTTYMMGAKPQFERLAEILATAEPAA